MNSKNRFKFKEHVLSDSELIWIKEVAATGITDQRVLKVRLRDRLPPSFQPASIDKRFYNDLGISPLGIWVLNPKDERLIAIDKTIRAIRDCIIESPGVEKFEASYIASRAVISDDQAGSALYLLGQIGRFWTSATGATKSPRTHAVVTLNGRDDYDEYLAYKDLDDLLERFYINSDPNRNYVDTQLPGQIEQTSGVPQRSPPRRRSGILATVFDEYSILGKLGEGGAGSVFEARDRSGKIWAIKILDPKKVSTETRKRFRNEVAFCQSPPSDHIIKIADSGVLQELDGSYTPFYVMERYKCSLRSIMQRGLPHSMIFECFAQILNGLEAAHSRNVIHRDIKPENILVSDDEKNFVIADFGIAHFEEEDLVTAVQTRAQKRLANFIYAAPEQATRGAKIDQRADIYSLGLILNELFTNEVPRGTGYKTIGEISREHAFLDSIVSAMLQQRLDSRIGSIDKLRAEIERQQLGLVKLKPKSRTEKKIRSQLVVQVNSKDLDAERKQLGGTQGSDLAATSYEEALETVKTGDLLTWRKLLRSTNEKVLPQLAAWRAKHDGKVPQSNEELVAATLDGAAILSPLIAIGLAGLNSENKKFTNQVALLEEVIQPKGWNRAGLVITAEMPECAAFFYQALYGAMCVYCGRLSTSVDFIRSRIELAHADNSKPIWRNHRIVGWPKSLPEDSKFIWNCLSSIGSTWPWLQAIFGDEIELKNAVTAHYMVLNVINYVEILATNREQELYDREMLVDTPLYFVRSDNDTKRRAYRLLIHDAEQVKYIWSLLDITDARFARHWSQWMTVCEAGVRNPYGFDSNRMPHSNLVKDIIKS